MRNLTPGKLVVSYLQVAPGRRGVACHRGKSNTCRAVSNPLAAGSCVFQRKTAPEYSSRSPRGITAPTWSLPNPSPASSVSLCRRQNPTLLVAPPLSLPLISPALPVPAPTRSPPFVPGTQKRNNGELYDLESNL